MRIWYIDLIQYPSSVYLLIIYLHILPYFRSPLQVTTIRIPVFRQIVYLKLLRYLRGRSMDVIHVSDIVNTKISEHYKKSTSDKSMKIFRLKQNIQKF